MRNESGELRNRRKANNDLSSQSNTIPSLIEDDRVIPPINTSEVNNGPRKAMGKDAIAKDEGRLKKILVRLVTGLMMVRFFRY